MIDKQPGLWIYPDGREVIQHTDEDRHPCAAPARGMCGRCSAAADYREKPMIDKQPGLWIYPDGREVIQHTEAGRKLLEQRREIAWRESQGFCCLCSDRVHPFEATLEHKTSKGAGGGKHDDRQSNLGISHLAGNVAKGSMSLEQYLKIPLDVRIRNCK